jgi:hypothetical protein
MVRIVIKEDKTEELRGKRFEDVMLLALQCLLDPYRRRDPRLRIHKAKIAGARRKVLSEIPL